MVKVFDTSQDDIRPNNELMTQCGYNVTRTNLSSDGRFVQISYPYIDGSHQPSSLQQFSGVISMLHKIHSCNFVHGDIRSENIIHSFDGKSYLIDFDLAKPEGELYPENYNYLGILERHEYAQERHPMLKEHDRFSLHKVMQRSNLVLPASQSVVAKVKSLESLDTIAVELLRK